MNKLGIQGLPNGELVNVLAWGSGESQDGTEVPMRVYERLSVEHASALKAWLAKLEPENEIDR